MQDVLTPQSDSFEIVPIEINSNAVITRKYKDFTLQLINVHHGVVPVLGLAILVDGKKIVISGDTNDANKNLEKIAQNADVKEIVLTHRMNRTLGKEKRTLELMHQIYKGKIIFADDGLTRILP